MSDFLVFDSQDPMFYFTGFLLAFIASVLFTLWATRNLSARDLLLCLIMGVFSWLLIAGLALGTLIAFTDWVYCHPWMKKKWFK